ncbi:hypothetical protein [Haloarchaeobius sp. HME9146]|uniref:hypothetical protein n=1 Tax=Haloarchaeobius sp. HME9146 TaxID=2978732 RepID=UPI0021BEA01F|nr:hypothetical protein [Haloarchaeobius sp. HME9146]MCT9095352.1 hypothetical protein [Haloarchaeobius sp. HME9146]
MTELTANERETLNNVIEGLALAISRSGELESDAVTKTSKTKLEKFIFQALADTDELDSITYSWYIAGAKTDTPNSELSIGALENAFNRVTGQTASPDVQKEFVDSRSDYNPIPEVERFAEYFLREFDLEDSWFTRGEMYLLDFYKERAPEDLRDLYVAVQELRNTLNYAIREIRRVKTDSPNEMTLSQFQVSSEVKGPDLYEEVADLVSEIHLQMAMDEQLKPLLSDFKAFSDILEDAFLALSQMNVERLSDSQLQMFQSLRRFYFYEAWKLPSYAISMRTASGPRAEDLKVRHAQEIEQHREEYKDKLEALRQDAASSALVPTATDYPCLSEDTPHIESLVERYLTTAK